MANLVYCEDNILLKNNYYFALSTSNVSNPTKIPTNHTGIADSGANGFYFTPDAPVDDYDPTAPTVGVRVANGNPARSVARATLASVPALPPASMQGHVMPSFTHTLIGLGPFADQGCSIVFTKTAVTVYHPDGRILLSGWRDLEGPRLWHFPLQLTPPAAPTEPRPPTSRLSVPLPDAPAQLQHPNVRQVTDHLGVACSVTYLHGPVQNLALAAKAAKIPFDPRSLDLPSIRALVSFYHACLGFPVKQTWLDAIKAGNCETFDGLTYSNAARYCPDANETIMGHLAQQQSECPLHQTQAACSDITPSICLPTASCLTI